MSVHVLKSSFNSGELAEEMDSRVAVEKYESGCRKLRNNILHTHGPVKRRPGMERLGNQKSHDVASKFIEFNFSVTTTFTIEMALGVFRFWSNGLLVMKDGVPYEVPHPYSPSEFRAVQPKQINDVMYFAHSDHHPYKLSRFADDNWTCTVMPIKYPALLDEYVEKESVATPIVTELLRVKTEEWPEFAGKGAPTGTAGNYSWYITSPSLGASAKVAAMQRWNGSAWVADLTNKSWTTVAPSSPTSGNLPSNSVMRMTYSGPAAASSDAVMEFRQGGVVVSSLSMHDPQRASLQPVTVPIGDWQARVICGPVVPAGATLILQKLVTATWVNVKTFTLAANATLLYTAPRLTAATQFRFLWTGRAMAGGIASIEQIVYPASESISVSVNATSGNDRTMTASQSLFKEDHVGSVWQIAHRREMSYTELVGVATTFTVFESNPIRVVGKWNVNTYGTWKGTLVLERKTPSNNWEILRTWSSNKDRNVAAEGEQLQDADLRLRVLSGMVGYTADGFAAVPRFLLESVDARTYGLVRIVEFTSATVVKVDVIRVLASMDATTLWAEGAWSKVNGYPAAIGLHQGRLWFGGTTKQPQTLWGSVSGDFENFRRSTFDDGSIAVTLASETGNGVKWIGSAAALLVGTSGEEWSISGANGSKVITPVSIEATWQSGYSSIALPSRKALDVTLFIQRDGRRIRQLVYDNGQQGYTAADLTVLASHITEGGIVQVAYQQSPTAVVWAVTGKGKLIGMTFEKEQNVFGWHVHDTDGFIETVAVTQGTPDTLTLGVAREINGAVRRSVERFCPRVMKGDYSDHSRMIFADAATLIDGDEEISAVTGLDHLEGKTVVVLGDGAVQTRKTVTAGSITLDTPAKVVVCGLPFGSVLQPMKQEVQLQDGTAQGRKMKLNRCIVRVLDSHGGEVSANGDDDSVTWEPLRYAGEVMDSAPVLFTGEIAVPLESRHESAVNLTIRQTDPLPLTVTGLIMNFDVYGQ